MTERAYLPGAAFRPIPTGTGFLCLLCLLWPLLTSCSKKDSAPASNAQVLRLSQRNEPATLDPQLATLPDEYFTARALFEGLTTPNPDGGDPRPGVAERWESSADHLVWTFHLRADAKWSNGDPVTAQDFIWSFRRMLTPSLGATKAPLFFAVRNARAYLEGGTSDFSAVGFSAPDARTLVVTLEHPAPYLPHLAATGAWLPLHPATVERHGVGRDSRWSEPGNLIGNGPYTLDTWARAQAITLRKNERYWDRQAVHVPTVRLVIFDNNDAEERAFRAGQIDVTMTVPAARLAHYQKTEPSLLRRQELFEVRCLSLNLRHKPLGDVRVRTALELAIDKAALTDQVLKGGQTAASSLLNWQLDDSLISPRGQVSAEPPLAQARRLLAEAGYPEGRGFPRLELATWTNPTVLEAIQQMWRQNLGIETAIVQREARVHLAALAAGDYDIAFVPFIPDYASPLDILGELVSSSPTNYGRWHHPDYDHLVHEAARTAGQANYRPLVKILFEEKPVIPLYFSSQNYLVAPRVKAWRSDPLWNRYYKHVSLDEN